MQTLIIYASKTGTTAKCANQINRELKDSKMLNILNYNEDISKYDLIIIGSPIRMGLIDKKIKKFLNRHRYCHNILYNYCRNEVIENQRRICP